MRINNSDKINEVYITNLNNKAKVNKQEQEEIKKDKVGVSEKGKDYQVALEKFRSLPDIRTDKVEKLKEEISTGTYKVEGSKIAEKMLEQGNFDKKI